MSAPAGSGPLERYRDKRDFARTPEPAPATKGPRSDQPVFVVHRHEATHLHYDLRLERDGVLCSWAVPKGFSYDSSKKHLAMRTEDHPLEYEHFSGVIPKGQYGAGTMLIWDRGHYTLLYETADHDPLAAGDIKLLLYGRKLRGEWHLVKTQGGPNHWLLFKSRDRYAGFERDSSLGIDLASAPVAPVPRAVRRMTVGGQAEPFSDPDWLFEADFAGRRVLAVKQGEQITLRGLRKKLPDVLAGLAGLRAENALLDGVLVSLDEHGRPSLELLEARLAGDEDGAIVFYAFDLLYYEDYDLRALALVERKAGLRALLPAHPHVLFMDHVPGNGESLAAAVAAAGLPGLIAKRARSPYVAGKSADWMRVRVPRAGEEGSAAGVTEALERVARTRRVSRVKLTNLDKVLWPAEGFTKGDLIAYYEAVADVLVPYMRGRPMHMNRFPDGIEGKSFYQKEAKPETPEWVTTIDIASRHRGAALRYMVCDDHDTLLYLANLASIDLHPWMSRACSQDSPDYAVIDLDPKEAPFTHVVRIAREVGRVLRGIGLRPLLKTSGKTGLHVVIPLIPGYTYDQTLAFCEGVARVVTRELQDIATVERALGSRAGKVYIDFGQNRKGQTVVPPYSARPVRGASVSAPLHWDELDSELTPQRFTIQNMPARLELAGDLFRPLFTDLQDLLPAIEQLADYVRQR